MISFHRAAPVLRLRATNRESRLSGWVLILFFTSGLLSCRPEVAAPGPAVASRGMVVSSHSLASQAGVAVMREGGNAIDAAVAVSFALAVVHPIAGNVGGGGSCSTTTPKPAGRSPWTIARWLRAAPAATCTWTPRERWFRSCPPSVIWPREFRVRGRAPPGLEPFRDPSLATFAGAGHRSGPERLRGGRTLLSIAGVGRSPPGAIRRDPAHLPAGRKSPGARANLHSADLARTLEAVARDGAEAFYRGGIAELIEREMEAHGGIMTREDLANYVARIRPAVRAVTGAMRSCPWVLPAPGA